VFTTSRLISNWLLVAVLPIALCACTSSDSAVLTPKKVTEAKAQSSPASVNNVNKLNTLQEERYSLLIHRADKRLEVINDQSVPIYNATIGIGKGGLKDKQNMNDFVTPTGEMSVDLILYKKSEYNQISQNNVKRFIKVTQYSNLVSPPQGLAQLFKNMNYLDFDGNSSSDRAYGNGYIGLTSTTSITGPKMSTFQGTPYWFSIALHGTPNPENIGQANSGGCIHLDSNTLQQLIEKGWVKLGTKVTIVD
jgi:hypothetical protein